MALKQGKCLGVGNESDSCLPAHARYRLQKFVLLFKGLIALNQFRYGCI